MHPAIHLKNGMNKTGPMDPKKQILDRIRSIRQAPKPYPPQAIESQETDLVEAFIGMVKLSGSTLLRFEDQQTMIDEFVKARHPVNEWVSTWDPLIRMGASEAGKITDARIVISCAVLPGKFGVAENGAVWVPEEAMGQRTIPFLAEHLILIVHAKDLVATMHQVYAVNQPGSYGLFIAGPSKTADIEQHLVLGAQGPLAHTVILLG